MNRGISLIESILYLTLILVIMPMLTMMVFFTVDSRVRSQNISLVNLEGSRISRIISQNIRNAGGINYPNLGTSSSTLSLVMADMDKDPMVFYLEDNRIFVKEGASAPSALTSQNITVDNLLFTNTSRAATPGSIRVEFALNAGSLFEEFYVSASLRHQ